MGVTESNFTTVIKRFRKDPKVGLALSSGSARGEAHVGVIKAIIEKGVPVDMIAGASAGAIVGAYFASRGNVDGLEKFIYEVTPKILRDMMSFDLAIKMKGFIGEEKPQKWLKELIGGVYFSDLKIPLAIIATDMQSGEEIVITKGSVLEAIRASIAMPVLFTPIKSQGRFLVDGGFSNPLPVNVLKNMGANFVIASNVVWTPELARSEFVKKGNSHRSGIHNIVLSDEVEKARKALLEAVTNAAGTAPAGDDEEMPNMLNVLINSIYTMEYALVKSSIRQADITISPSLPDLNMLDFFQGKKVVANGYQTALKRLSKLINGLKREVSPGLNRG